MSGPAQDHRIYSLSLGRRYLLPTYLNVAALAEEHAGKLKVVKVDIQSNMKTPGQFKVTAIPTLLGFKGGQMVGRQSGAAGGLPALRSFVAPVRVGHRPGTGD